MLISLNNDLQIKCGHVQYIPYGGKPVTAILKVNHSEKDYKDFLELLDFDYDSGFGSQDLFGTIWIEDGSWLSRGEYDGSEWWEHNKLPAIVEQCL